MRSQRREGLGDDGRRVQNSIARGHVMYHDAPPQYTDPGQSSTGRFPAAIVYKADDGFVKTTASNC